MKTTKTQKASPIFALTVIVTSVLAWASPGDAYKAVMENDFIRSIKEKLTEHNQKLPEDRLYLQLDKPFYEPGDDVWFAAYIRDGLSLKSSTKSDVIHIELINPKGTVEKKISIVAKNGKAAGDFSIDKEALGGLYKIRAYTNWMKNENEENAFVKDLQVQDVVLPALKMKLDFDKKAFGAGDEVVAKLELNTNENLALSNHKIKYTANINGEKIVEESDITDENGMKYVKFVLPKKLKSNDGLLNIMIDYNGSTESISSSIPIILNTVKFNVYPEGGDLLNSFENNVAFRALNEFNKPADIEGVVITEKGSQVASFSSFHQGMGAFKFNPQPNEKYKIKITKPEGIGETFALPQALDRGYILNIDNSKPEQITVNVSSTETEAMAVVAQVRGKIYYSTLIDVVNGINKFSFPTASFPIGVAQITLFDSKGIARAERLAFVNKNKQLNVSVETEKEKYLPREKVKMTVTVKDERGLPMPANLSLAVVNDQLLSFADDKSGNILSQLLLQQDIKEKIEEPAFYFNKKENKADKALDYLMLTSGWRRFTWEKLLEGELPQINYPGQKAILAGSVIDANTGKPIESAKIKIASGKEYEVSTDGKFSLKYMDLTQPLGITYNAEGYYPSTQYVYDYNQNLVVYLYKNTYSYYGYPKSSVKKAVMAGGAVNEEMMALPGSAKGLEVEKAENLKDMIGSGHNKPKSLQGPSDHSKIKIDANKQKEPKRELAHAKRKEVVQEVNGAAVRADDRRFKNDLDMLDEEQNIPAANANLYYRARQFYTPDYEKQQVAENRTDFRNTIYWNPNIEVGYSGKKTIEFYASDDITSFRTTVEGISGDGTVGRVEKNFFTQLPFAMTTKIPVEVATEDFVSIPLTLKNNTNGPLGGIITITSPEGLKEITKLNPVQTIMPGAAKTIYLDYKVLDKIGEGEFTIAFKACGLGDAFTQKIKIAPKGFPVQTSFSAQEVEKEYTFEINKMINGSLKASFTAFPNVVSDLMKGIEGILQEPYGCFEQTSCTAYPNAMVLDYMKNTDSKDSKVLARATDLLDRGYKRLTTFETKDKGYEWFGANPAHEGLTAYGIMEFVDMKKAGQNIDSKMLDRTAMWLMSKKDGKGGFKREQHAYHDFGRISEDILNGYIVYALSEAGYTDIEKEFEACYKKAMELKDPYMLAMIANASYSMNKKTKGDEALMVLLSKQAKDGSFTGSTHSITYSQGNSLTIETTALSIIAALKSQGKNAGALTNAVQFLTGTRSGSGVFSSTQGTILALKALTEYAKSSKKTSEDGTIAIYIDGKKVSEKNYKAGDKGAINVEGLEQFIKGEGKHTLKVKYSGVKTPLPYSVAINWSTTLPNSDEACVIDLKTKLSSKTANVGETVRLTTTITNKKNTDVPSTMAIIGIPAGFTAQPWQLKELQEKNVFDYYEIKGNNIAVYYRGLAPKAVKEINLDLKAEMPGEYDTPASSAYLYYTNEFKTWSAVEKVTIKKNI
ncbi:MAG: large extracellular alpha-helical protein [Bacteroidetes bacterium]|nr:large extracellular alpha-helical protein [Bacteroidota bacterium]